MTSTANEPAVRRKKRSIGEVLRALGRPKVAVMLALGFSSGLPFMLIGNTLGYWLREGGVSLATIGFLSWVGLAYSFKFLWAPLIDRLGVPGLAHLLGRRRGWMMLAQVVIGVGLVGMALSGPQNGFRVIAAFAVLTAFAAATQDIVVDAWRIEIADDADELGLLTSAYTLGYRAALLATEAVILVLATYVGWPVSYVIFGLLMGVGVVATLLAKEPAAADAVLEQKSEAAPLWTPRGLSDAIAGPFVEFFRRHGNLAALVLLTITLYHLPDYLRGPVGNPFYHDAGIAKATVGWVRGTIGLWSTLVGVAAGGLCAVRLGYMKTLIIGAVIQPIGIVGFSLLAYYGPNLALFSGIMSVDAFAIGFSGVALAAYMSSLTSLGYTASQYAVMTSALAWSGKFLKGFSGEVVESLQKTHGVMQGYALFYIGAAAIGASAVIFCLLLANQTKERAKAALAQASA